ncbi:hypothetical protein C8J56DRAFT_1037431 [Mycena floridula]|nr:hypothetical protein C8J56DRAFT_1037431 [Mycena floridula]
MIFPVTFIILAVASAVSATTCPACPSTDLAGDPLVANSGGTRGAPRFCGYTTTPGTGNIEIECFYSASNGALSSSNSASCPPNAPIMDIC